LSSYNFVHCIIEKNRVRSISLCRSALKDYVESYFVFFWVLLYFLRILEVIFVDEELQGFNGNEDDPLRPSTSSPELISASTLEAEAHQATTSSTTVVEVSRIEGEIISESVLPFTFRRHIHLNRS
jgi:hypothetical protein